MLPKHLMASAAPILSIALTVPLALASAPPWPPEVPTLDGREAADPGPLPASVTATPRADGTWDVRFCLQGAPEARRVCLAGDFNGWNREALELHRGGGEWCATLALDAGTWHYKFVVDGETWIPDPRNPDAVDDNHGGVNSRVRVGGPEALGAADATRGDGRIAVSALEHRPVRPTYVQAIAAGTRLVRYRTLAGDVDGVELAVDGRERCAMSIVLHGGPFDVWEVTVEGVSAGNEYTFVVHDGDTVARDPQIHSFGDGSRRLRTPEWARHAIWYQIMPDRFRNGDGDNDPAHAPPWTGDWYQPTATERASGKGFYEFVFERLYGGDLRGVQAKLGYLKGLGVNALYLTPIFQARSHHRYDATSYLHVDELLGTRGDYAAAEASEDLLDPSTWSWTGSDLLFLHFLREAKSQGFRVIIDGVFNHVGTGHPAFRDVRAKGERSRFADWFAVRSWSPFEYEGWAGFPSLPTFRKSERHGIASDSARRHILDITRRWMDPDGDGDPSDGVDGWRLDVPNEVPMAFWHEWRTLVKSINPDAYLVGEIWKQDDTWLDGRSFDGLMNYPFADAAIAWVGHRKRKITASALDRRLAELRLAYPSDATYVLQNLLDSHDTDRLASMMANPDRDYNTRNRPQDGASEYMAGKPDAAAYRKARLLALLQMTYVGAPMIWYGDEVGMWGPSDPSNRKPMLWKDLEPYARPDEDAVMDEQLAWYRAVGALRAGTAALRVGSFRTVLADDAADVWAFERQEAGHRVIVALNASERDAIVTLPRLPAGGWRETFSSSTATYSPEGRACADGFPTVVVPALGGMVWEVRE